MTDDCSSSPLRHAYAAVPEARRIVVRHLRDLAAGEAPYQTAMLPFPARDMLLAAADIIEDDGRRLN